MNSAFVTRRPSSGKIHSGGEIKGHDLHDFELLVYNSPLVDNSGESQQFTDNLRALICFPEPHKCENSDTLWTIIIIEVAQVTSTPNFIMCSFNLAEKNPVVLCLVLTRTSAVSQQVVTRGKKP